MNSDHRDPHQEITDLDRRTILAAQPLFRMQQFAALLGWRGLELYSHLFMPDDRCLTWSLIVWYMTTDRKFFFQINPYPQGQAIQYQATVVATRYGLPTWVVGFHDFQLGDSDDELRENAERLQPILARRNFKNRDWRKRWKIKAQAGIDARNAGCSLSAFLRSYSPEDEGLYGDLPAPESKSS